jgi:hypothetical protein
MPYKIVHGVKNGIVRYAVKNTSTGKSSMSRHRPRKSLDAETHGWTTKDKAEAQMRILINRATNES